MGARLKHNARQVSFDFKSRLVSGVLRPILEYASTRISALAIGQFMRDAKGEGPRSPADGGRLRIVSARLARSIADTRGRIDDTGGSGEGYVSAEIVGDGVMKMKKGSRVPYAGAHEDGLDRTVAVRAHTRRITQAFGRQIAPTSMQVRAHEARRNTPARPYLAPALSRAIPGVVKFAARRMRDFIVDLIRRSK